MEFDVEEFNILIAETVNQRRFEMKISQRELARRAKVSHLTIAIIEGTRGFNKQHGVFTLFKVCSALNINLSDLFKKIEEKHKE